MCPPPRSPSRKAPSEPLWEPYRTASGRLLDERLFVARGFGSPPSHGRDLFAAVPRDRATHRRAGSPVFYIQDGQNLFDEEASYAGTWRGLEALDRLERRGRPAILVGIANAGRSRFAEYAPLIPRADGPPEAERYLGFLVERVLPAVEDHFGIAPEASHRGVAGSSLGGLFSLWAYFSRPTVFGLCGAFSPSLQIRPQEILAFVEKAHRPRGRIYLDVGTREVSRPRPHFNSRHYGAHVTRMRNLLQGKGYRRGRDLRFVREARGIHHESAWARRLPGALEFLLAEARS